MIASKRGAMGALSSRRPKTSVLGGFARGYVSPTAYSGLAAWYDVGDASSLLNNAGSAPSNGDGIKLIADKSGNSATNCLCTSSAAGNYASAPDSAALSITGSVSLAARLAMDDWTPSAVQGVIAKNKASTNQRSYRIYVTTAGRLEFEYSTDGTGAGLRTATSSAAPTVSDLGWLWVMSTYNSATGKVNFYTAPDSTSLPTAWTILGAEQTVVAGNIFDGSALLHIGALDDVNNSLAGRIGRAVVWSGVVAANGTGGTVVFDANFASASKLATSFTEGSSNAATVTITGSGDSGARISGERDYFNATAANQVTYNLAGRYVRGDGVSDYLRTPLFSLAQPFTRISVIRQNTWTSGDHLLGGAAGANTAGLVQTTATPQLNITAGSSVAANTELAVATLGIVTEIFNGASSSLQVNRTTATTGNAGTGTPNGLTLFASGATPAANFADADLCEQVVFSGALDAVVIQRLQLSLATKWGLAV